MAFPTAFTFAVAQWHIPAQPAVVAYLWAWLESQMMAAIKLVPSAKPTGNAFCSRSVIADDALGSFAPALDLILIESGGDNLVATFSP
jgi:urease accessory protein